MKKQFYNLFIIILLLSNNFVKAVKSSELPTPQTSMDEAFKNVDFEQMLKELEEIFGSDLEEKTSAPKKDGITPETKKAVPTPAAEKETLEERFKNPVKPEGKEEKVVAKLPKEKMEAFDYYINNFLTELKKLDVKISSFNLGIAFKEKLEDLNLPKTTPMVSQEESEEKYTKKKQEDVEQPVKKEALDSYKSIISNIEKSLSIIQGRKPNPKRKMYRKVFFLPLFTELREQIINQTKELENINNRIVDFEKISEEEKEKAEIEELQALAGKKPSAGIKVPEKLKKDIELNFKNLKEIADKLESVTASNQAKSLIESKKKKREEEAKKSAERRKAEQKGYKPYYPKSPSSPWGRQGGYWPSDRDEYWGGAPSGYTPTTTKPGGLETKPSEIKPTDKPEEKAARGGKKDKDEKEKDKETVENLSKNTVDLIDQVLKSYKADDEKSYDEILDTHSLSKISQNLDDISKLKLKSETKKEEGKEAPSLTKRTIEQKKEEISFDKKLEDALKKFTPACVRLAKHHGGAEDQKNAAKNILKELKTGNLQHTVNTEIGKYEDEVLKRIDPKVLTEYDSGKNLDSVLKNLKVALSLPLSNQENIDEKKAAVAASVTTGLDKTTTLENKLEQRTRGIEQEIEPEEWKSKYEQEKRTKSDEEIQNRLKHQKEILEKIRFLVSEGKGIEPERAPAPLETRGIVPQPEPQAQEAETKTESLEEGKYWEKLEATSAEAE